MMYQRQFSLLVMTCLSLSLSVGAQAQAYSEKQKQEILQRLQGEANKNQQSQIENLDLYNKYLFWVNQKAYGGYESVKVDVADYRNDERLTEAQKNSIGNSIKRAELMKELLENKQ